MHTTPPRHRPVLWTLAAVALAVTGGLSAVAPSPQDPGSATLDAVTNWDDVDRLVSEQKLEAASEAVGRILDRAQADGDAAEWTRALVEQAKLRIALHGYETAVRDLVGAEWPDDPTARAVLDLYTAHALVTYDRAYSWEIRQRERVVSSDEIDLKRWTHDQIIAEANARFARLWSERDAWGATPIGKLARYIQQNSYPPRIRGTLRDAITYLWVELLADTSLWRPEQASDVYLLDLQALLAGPAAPPDLDDPRVHPLVKIGFLTADLERWHHSGRRPEAALEAFLERARRLHDGFSRDDDRDTIRGALAARLRAFDRSLAWWAAGQAELARMTQADDVPDALVRAHALALAGFERHPSTVGGQRCEHVVRSIEAPRYSVQGMAADGVGRASLRLEHANLDGVWFRAYLYDLDEWFATSEDRNIFPSWREVPEFLRGRTPDAEWKVDLPPTPDYRSHATDVVPPINTPGAYVVVTSARSDFEANGNQLTAVHLIVGDLVLVTRSVGGRWEVETRSGATGEPRPNVAVTLWRTDWRRGHYPVDRRTSDATGRVSFAHPGDGGTHFLIGRSGDEVAVQAGSLYPHFESAPGTTTSALISTDRAVYRPGQTLYYKVIAYSGGGDDSRFRTLPDRPLTVRLRDGNYEIVSEAELETNDFGTASGTFEIPSGRLLGGWQLEASLGGATAVRVEEYKRPTFEVTLEAPDEALRLNRPAALDGEARYYFGLPVTDATVRWTVTREPVYPRWGWWWWQPPEAPRIVAAGEAELDADGRFTVAFTPEADERRADEKGLSYRFRVTAEVTDPGGETRSGNRGFRLGFVAVETRVDLDRGFLAGGERADVTVHRADLDGTPRAGTSTWRLAALDQPDRTLTPAQQPLPPPRWPDGYHTEGDRTRPRWQPGYDPRAVLASWDEGRTVASGALAHGDDGAAVATLPRLEPGAYRMTVETTDPFGAVAVTTHDVVVARDRRTPLELPALLAVESDSVPVGGTARLFVHSGFDHQRIVLELQRGGRRIERRVLVSGRDNEIVEIPVTRELRGGFGVVVTVLRDHQLVTQSASVAVPWDDKQLDVAFATFRDRLRPGDSETFRVSVRAPDDETLAAGAVELLASMYDRSLDLFAVHSPPDPLALYPTWTWVRGPDSTLGVAPQLWNDGSGLASVPPWPWLQSDQLIQPSGYGIGGPGRRGMVGGVYAEEGAAYRMTAKAQIASDEVADAAPMPASVANEREAKTDSDTATITEAAPELRTDFSETAFFSPHLLLDVDGGVDIEFTVPDSVTEWTFWVQAITRDLEAGAAKRNLKTVKELMVRPAVPRFLREGDVAELAVVVNNAGDEPLAGALDLRIVDPADGSDLGDAFALTGATGVPFAVNPGGSATLTFPIAVPPRPGLVAFEAVARAGDFSDGERRPLPVLPGRMHLIQSRFAALRDVDSRELVFGDMRDDDPTLIHDQLVVTVNAQLFYGVLESLPYLVDYPYECTEQTLNRFLSTGIVTSVFDDFPAVAKMAAELAARNTRYEQWDADDPNRRMLLEETPWLRTARGGADDPEDLLRVLDPDVAAAVRRAALADLEKAQTSLGGFPWWPGGPPSPYMTLYIVYGFSKALEFGVDVPQPVVRRAFGYLHRWYLDEMVDRMLGLDCCWEFVTYLNYVLSNFPDPSWYEGTFTPDDRARMLEHSWRHWREHQPLLKGYLALTLHREGRTDDARLVWDSVMDSAKTDRDLGTYWAPEDRAWLWYNDTTETHAFALRVLSELEPDDDRRDGIVQWLFLDKKLAHWKSTRTTAEVIYSLVHFLRQEEQLGVREEVTVEVGPRRTVFTFDPDEYTGKAARVVIPGPEIDPDTMAVTRVSKETPGLAFASATWHYSTEKLPAEARGDLFGVTRTYFRRVQTGDEYVLEPLSDGARIEVGDQLEVHLSIRAKHAAEYVHVRDPRGAGFEPERLTSGWRWDLGISAYEEVRDSGTNFFFEWLPTGEYTLTYRLRASMAGTFKVAPATMQSMYAPEFAAFSAGDVVTVTARE